MDDNVPNEKNLYSIRYTISKRDIGNFVDSLHQLQEQYLEQALEKTGYREANAAIQRIMEMK